ncbi:MAG: CoA transferase [Actinobacteria bacterium]|nr:CoA transferase [Actinomycetota bacterium]
MHENAADNPLGGALDGITVVDLTRQMAGPYGSLVLADFGADVIKVESSPHGDPSRRTGTHFIEGESTMFLTWNRNKRSVCVDLRSEAGKKVVRRLIADADVFMENYRPGVADAIGVGYEAMRELNPRLVYCSVNAFGSKGPWAERPGTDPVVQAFSGVMSVTGERDGGPVLVGIPIADYTGAMLAVQGVLLALQARERTGQGQHVEIPMIGALLFGLTTRVGPFFQTGEDPVRWGSQHSQVVPYQAFETSDGWAVAGVWGDDGWAAFCDALEWPELATDERFDTNVKRVERRDELGPLLQERFVERTTADWEERFTAHRVLFSPVHTFSQVLRHEQVRANGLVTQVEHPTIGSLDQIGPVVQLRSTPAQVRSAPPLLGQHTVEVLRERGWTDDEIQELLDDGAVVANELEPTGGQPRG